MIKEENTFDQTREGIYLVSGRKHSKIKFVSVSDQTLPFEALFAEHPEQSLLERIDDVFHNPSFLFVDSIHRSKKIRYVGSYFRKTTV